MVLAILLLLRASTVDLAAVGDVMLGRFVGYRVERLGADAVFEGAAQELRRSDLCFANLECALSNAPFAVSKHYLLKASPWLAGDLAKAGFGVVSVANNHSLDCGLSGLHQTLQVLGKAHILSVGAQAKPVIVSRLGVRIAFLAYCDFPSQSGGRGINYTDERSLGADIARARSEADVVVVSWHWGVELSPEVSARQRRLAKLAASSGADVVIGHHPHVLQRLEWLPARNGRRCLVAYSLGNFIFDSRPGPESQTEILHVQLTRHGAVGYRTSPYTIVRYSPVPAK